MLQKAGADGVFLLPASRRVWMRLLLVAVTLGIVACSNAVSRGRGDSDSGVGRGTKACRDWQDAICDYAADRCHMLSRDTCDQQYQGATCKSDAAASSCATQLDKSACGRAPEGCSLTGVADPGPAARACDQLFDAFCERYISCGLFETTEACRADPSVMIVDCAKAIAYNLDYEACFEEAQALQCDVLMRPQICRRVIVQTSD
jgi:hypothetical protein